MGGGDNGPVVNLGQAFAKNKVTLMVGFVKWAQGSVIKGGLVQIVRWDPLLATVGLCGCPGHPLQSWLVALQDGTRARFRCFLFKPRGPFWRRTNEGGKRAASTVFGSKTVLYVLRTILRTAMCIGCSFSRSHGTWEYGSHHDGRLASHITSLVTTRVRGMRHIDRSRRSYWMVIRGSCSPTSKVPSARRG